LQAQAERSLRAPGRPDLHLAPIVAPFVGGRGGWYEIAHYLVAGLYGLYGLYPQPINLDQRRSLGASLAPLADGRATARRIAQLLTGDTEQVPFPLRDLVRTAKRRGLPVDYAQLLRDLVAWRREDRAVQRRWARDYYGAPRTVEVSVDRGDRPGGPTPALRDGAEE
jgi:CRISPR type I-E-associated protein CasB/Cse2